MKSKLIILTLALFAFTTYRAEAQVDATISPLGLIISGNITVGADFVLSDNLSVEANVGYRTRTDNLTVSGTSAADFRYTGIPVMAIGKYYFNPDNGADKFYVDAFLRYVNRSYKEQDVDTSVDNFTQSRFGAGVGLGYKIVSRSGVVFDFNFGAGRVFADNTTYENDNGQQPIDLPGIIITSKIGVGYRFGQ